MAWRGVIRRLHLFGFYIWSVSPPSGSLISLVLYTSFWIGIFREPHIS